MIVPLFRERMQRIKTPQWTVRLWFDNDAASFPREGLSLLSDKIKRLLPDSTAETVTGVIENHFQPDEGLAACEILSNGTLNGVVNYYNWP